MHKLTPTQVIKAWSPEKSRFYDVLPLIFLAVALMLISSCKKAAEDQQYNSAPDEIGAATNGKNVIGINVVFKTTIDDASIAKLKSFGNISEVFPVINGISMRTASGNLETIRSLSFVKSASPDAERQGGPIDAVSVSDFANGLNTWNLDAVNVTDFRAGRTITQDGSGVYVGVLDTGLPDSWRQYFPEERIATQYAISFGGGGQDAGNVSTQPNKWEHDQNSHGGHVTSTIIGFNLRGTSINGVAPKATIIPVKVLNQNGSGWSSVIAQGILYMASLKEGPLSGHPVVINMSLGGSRLDPLEEAAIDYAISKGVIIVASAGNSGTAGMGYPGAYAPVISVGAAGWKGEWTVSSWWYSTDVADPTNVSDFYITGFSSRELPGQDLDVVAPGSLVVGPYQVNSGQTSYYFLGGTSMASPHVAGIVALMAQKKASLTAGEAETDLENAALPMPAGSLVVGLSNGTTTTKTWGDDATGHGFITADAAVAAVN